MRRHTGFTVAELVTVVAIVGILASAAIPVVRFGMRRDAEMTLRRRLERFAWAIDYYHDLRIKGVIKQPPGIGQGEYPKDLQELTKPIELIDGKKINLLHERELIDPMTGKTEWRTLASTDENDSPSLKGDNVWDVHSTSTELSLDGKTHYYEW